MSFIASEIITQLHDLQPAIWDTVAKTITESINQSVSFGSPLVVSTKPQELNSDFDGSMLLIQFAMVSHPESMQQVVIPSETLSALARLATGMDIPEIDENVVADLRPAAEAIIQGLCLALGAQIGETVVATGLTIRYNPYQLPTNFSKQAEIVRCNIGISGEDLNGTIVWMFDIETAGALLKMPGLEPPEEGAAFSQISDTHPNIVNNGYAGKAPLLPEHDPAALDVLLDVPLEISVELGRVRMMVKEVLDLGTGSIIEVDKAAGEPVDVMVNGRLVAKGEVVVIEDNFGVRITEVIDPNARFRAEAA